MFAHSIVNLFYIAFIDTPFDRLLCLFLIISYVWLFFLVVSIKCHCIGLLECSVQSFYTVFHVIIATDYNITYIIFIVHQTIQMILKLSNKTFDLTTWSNLFQSTFVQTGPLTFGLCDLLYYLWVINYLNVSLLRNHCC